MSSLRHPEFLGQLKQQLDLAASSNNLILPSRMAKASIEPPLLRGSQIYPRMKELVADAEAEVLLANYQINENCDGEKDFLEALQVLNEKAKRTGKSIRVCILINNKTGPAARLSTKTSSNAFKKGTYSFPYLDFQYTEHAHPLFGSYHSKMIIIDGQSVMFPSCDLMRADNYKDGKSRWADMSSVLHGSSLAGHCREDFIRRWNSKKTQPLSGKKLAIPPVLEVKAERAILEADIISEADVLFLSKKANGNYFKRSNLSPYALALINGINRADKSINLAAPNLNHYLVIQALAKAIKRGVSVNIVMPKHANDLPESKPGMGGRNQASIQLLHDLISDAPREQRAKLDIRWTTDDAGLEVTGSKGLTNSKDINNLHARMVCIDDEITLTGSSVNDNQSFYYSGECDVAIHSPEVAKTYNRNIFYAFFDKGRKINEDPYNLIVDKSDKVDLQLDTILANVFEKISYWSKVVPANEEERTILIDKLKILKLDLDLVLRNITQCKTLISADHYKMLLERHEFAKKQFKIVKSRGSMKVAVSAALPFPGKSQIKSQSRSALTFSSPIKTDPQQWYVLHGKTNSQYQYVKKSLLVAEKTLRQTLTQPPTTPTSHLQYAPPLQEDVLRLSMHQLPQTEDASEALRFGFMEKCVKPGQEIVSQVVLPKNPSLEEEWLQIVDQQVLESETLLGKKSSSITLNSLDWSELAPKQRELGPYEKAVIQYCLAWNLSCHVMNGEKETALATKFLRGLIPDVDPLEVKQRILESRALRTASLEEKATTSRPEL